MSNQHTAFSQPVVNAGKLRQNLGSGICNLVGEKNCRANVLFPGTLVAEMPKPSLGKGIITRQELLQSFAAQRVSYQRMLNPTRQ